MFRNVSQDLSQSTWSASSESTVLSSGTSLGKEGQGDNENAVDADMPEDKRQKKEIKVGDCLPYGPRMYYETSDNVVRMKDIGENNRILLIGVIGSFTPDCWNRHLFRVLKNLRYYEEREVDYICCISTNDAYTQKAWGAYLGCDETLLMWADTSKRFTKAMGTDIVIPWLDNNIRSKRYVLLAENMVVTKMIMAPCDTPKVKWQCEHLAQEEDEDEEESDESSI